MRLSSFEGIDSITKKAQSKMEWIAIQLHARHPIGQEVKSKVIETKLDLTGAEVLAVMQCLRNNNFPIGSNQNGYFWAFSDKELVSTWNHISERESSLTETKRQLSFTMQEMRRGNHRLPTDSGKLKL